MNTKEAYLFIRNYFKDKSHPWGYDDNDGACLYRAPNGAKCAIGILIPDKQYDPSFEGHSTECVIDQIPALEGIDFDFLIQAQSAHDDAASWRHEYDPSTKISREIPEIERRDLFLQKIDDAARMTGILKDY